VRLLIVRTVGRADQLWQRYVVKRGSSQLQPRHPPARVVGELVFWLMMILFVTLAAEILGLGVFVTWLKQIVAYLPLAVAGLLIVLVGFVVSSLARDLIGTAAASAGLTHGDLLGRAAQMVILAVAVIIGIDQIGIDIGFLSVVAGIVLASMLGGIALAFGLGARTHVSNIIAANQLRGRYRVGDRIRIGEIEGQIAEIAVARLTVETETGTVDVPAKLFDEQVTVLTDRGA
jgi:small-conductance mechanosensitive channel